MTVIKVLYVDDEENNLSSFKANFRRLYEIYTASSGAGALDILSQTEVHVVISDQRMPEMTGVELFKRVKKLYPEPIRILLTGYTDIEALAEAINEGDIYRYITKPWNEIELNNGIQNAYDVFKTRRELKDKVVELEKTNDELNRFIYSISHELRAPLASALGVINLAKLDNVYSESEKGHEYWGLIEDCCARLDYNITSTLQYYKNSRYSTIKEEVDFQKLVNDLIVVHKLANNVEDKIKFEVNIDQPERFVGDVFRIEIIIGNLISNAIKYQNPDEENKLIRIDVKVNRLDAIISIVDNGLGILNDHLNKIFNQFFRVHNQKGTGLGLFIVREALAKLDGKISVESVVNSGTKFTLRIPNEL
ncbi:hybrid sensor histidine kinase/response regulator [Niabella sp. CJ426]|jgi:signal transduction histidine kinase|uniref:hybrid sensor histidine kinase/response regulator n=1 Tax=unclassified Niabella TaxID=2646634 RepID=UPI003CFF9614